MAQTSAIKWQEKRGTESHLRYHQRSPRGGESFARCKRDGEWKNSLMPATAYKCHMRHQTARSKENGKGKGKPWYKHGTDKNLFLKKNLQRKKNSLPLQPNAEIAQLVEHDLAKVGVASSSLVFRSNVNDSLHGCRFALLLVHDGPDERPRCPRGAAFRQEGGGFDKSEFLRLPWSTFSNS